MEMWADPSAGPDFCIATPDGFSAYRCGRLKKRGGGLALIHRNDFPDKMEMIPSMVCEAFNFNIMLSNQQSFKGTLLYRPPGPRGDFLSVVGNLLEPAAGEYSFTILGDFNFHLEATEDQDSISLTSELEVLGLFQRVTGPTHSAGHTLYGLFTNNELILVKEILPLTWSDHHAVLFDISMLHPTSLHPQLNPPKQFKAWSGIDQALLKQHLIDTQPEDVPDQELATTNYTGWLQSAFTKLGPYKSVSENRKAPSAPWFSEALRLEKQWCRKQERRWHLDYDNQEKSCLKLALANYKRLILTEKSNYYTRKIETTQDSSKQLFQVVSKLAGPADSSAKIASQSLCDLLARSFHDEVGQIYSNFSLPPLWAGINWMQIAREGTASTSGNLGQSQWNR